MPRRLKPHILSTVLRTDTDLDLDVHPFNIPAVREMDRIEYHPNVTFFVGENGSGKSTVLEGLALAMGFGPEGGTKNIRVSTTDSVSGLHDHMRVARGVPAPRDGFFLRAESLFNIATYVDGVDASGSYGGKSLHRQSHGEAFLAVMLNRFGGRGLYLLDEPEAALSPARQLAALRLIHDLVEDGSQFIIATHSPILLAYPHARIYRFGSEGIEAIAYEDTEHFTITRDFLNHHEKRIEQLLNDSDA
ncbi:AAA family ATPase [Mitsuaria sp. GD03876]|uniref:AAA family ATPase n=1 Tax=Mitsuaria sp. GD03876 TaxID=2975399 RepID=UPI0024482561|nr:AAA family ATPase [Mitsuaria sp. GD03876]MDH0867374.1 AAA family ATPase [Mitsuaria sp. GD03876]